jgi:hypothetical protein
MDLVLESDGTVENDPKTMSPKERFRAVVGIAFAFCILSFIRIGTVAEERGADPQDVFVRAVTLSRNKSVASPADATGHEGPNQDAPFHESCSCTARRIEKFQGDLFNRSDLLRLTQTAKEKMIDTIKEDYGEYFEKIFVGPGTSFTPLSDVSNDRLKRKLMIKVLEMQTALLQKGCDCDDGSEENTFAKYVWATGGHSAAAGHGNLFDESYTAVLGRDARTVFQAIGIHFEDRNYAMGGTSSGSEISMCWEQIFGKDVDFFVWDYGMTDSHLVHRMMHFGYRGGVSTGRPVLLGMNVGGRARSVREKAMSDLEAMGMAVWYGSEESYAARLESVPDSAAGLTQDQIDALPRMIRNFRCGESFEKGEPFCGSEKYSTHTCPIRKKQAPWHPGL